jgi:hypothetical protein
LGAFPAALRPETGLSAPILCTASAAHKYFRFYPLRGGKPAWFCGHAKNSNISKFAGYQPPLTERNLTDIL